MITTKELNEVTLSPTKKDYYQIWNELIELADKISDRWSPASTNESDPGIVLLKALTAIADKLNYNIDKNTLEAFMPSATQEESMRKLTEMMGYSMKYYQAATCDVAFSFNDLPEKTLSSFGSAGIYFPRFINLKNKDENINYVTLKEFSLTTNEPVFKVVAAEGELRECETDSDNIISLLHLDDNQRYYFPEVNVAENCVFVTNIETNAFGEYGEESADWQQVYNLNTQLLGSKVFKFGFDSRKQLPYIQFPEDISHLIKDGLRVRYIRTNGLSGNISASVLSTMEVPSIWSTADDDEIKSLNKDNFTVDNVTAATNGANPESLNAAYNNYKKTVGTFDTLVTCRDYMNKIYQMTKSSTDTTPLVSNVIVSDIRDDINRAVTICSFDEYGICYSDHSLKNENNANQIDHFDLVLYPFKTAVLNTKTSYENSFTYNAENNHKIIRDLEVNKTIAHNIVNPGPTEIYCIKNYLRLKARIATTKKVTKTEENSILENIYNAIYSNFNSRHIDFGEEIPYDTILEVVKKADPRIKDVNLDEPTLYTKICDRNGEYAVVSVADGTDNTDTSIARGKELYNKLALRNVLAGRIAAFQYDNDFETDYSESTYSYTSDLVPTAYSNIYPTGSNYITSIESQFNVIANSDELNANPSYSADKGLKLLSNQVIQFRTPSLKTVKTYPSYVNYFLKLNLNESNKEPIPATFISLRNFMESVVPSDSADRTEGDSANITYWEKFLNYLVESNILTTSISNFSTEDLSSAEEFTRKLDFYGTIFNVSTSGNATTITYLSDYSDFDNTKTYSYFELKTTTLSRFNNWLKTLYVSSNEKLNGLYRSVGVKLNSVMGECVTADLEKFMAVNEFTNASTTYLDRYHVQQTHSATEIENDSKNTKRNFTRDGLGQNGESQNIPKDAEYQLKTNECLLINYTNSSKDNSGNETKTVVNEYYGPGTIIKPNFALVDSELYNKNHTFSKKDGFYFADMPNCRGMFTLGTDEQICIREIIKVELDEQSTNLYWELNSDDAEKLTNTFKFTEDYGLDEDRKDANGDIWATNEHNAYTLKDGEHIYYTDSRKSDLAYYGAGTVVVRSKGTEDLVKYNSEEEVSEEDIMEYGLTASIPWKIVHLNDNGDTKRKITLIENQYLTLTEGDLLKYIDNNSTNAKSFSVSLTNNWIPIKGATYKLAESETEASLPQIDIEGLSWSARSRLNFNMSKSTTQVLHRNEVLKIYMNSISNTALDPDPIEIKPVVIDGNAKEISLNSNYLCQAATERVDVTKVNFGGIADFSTKDFKIKLSEKVLPAYAGSGSNTVALNNYSNGANYYTKFSLGTLAEEIKTSIKSNNPANLCFSLKINMDAAKHKCGLIMFYYLDKNSGTTDHTNAYIKVKNGSTSLNIKKFNTTGTGTDTFILTPGIQVLQIPTNATSLEIYADKEYQSNIIFSKLSIIKESAETNGVNPELNYHKIDSENSYLQLLEDIKNTKVADKFYYNCPIDNSNAIEINELIEDETLASPYVWYDPNNVNNKFVISEIDADYLKTGITLTRSSRV